MCSLWVLNKLLKSYIICSCSWTWFIGKWKQKGKMAVLRRIPYLGKRWRGRPASQAFCFSHRIHSMEFPLFDKTLLTTIKPHTVAVALHGRIPYYPCLWSGKKRCGEVKHLPQATQRKENHLKTNTVHLSSAPSPKEPMTSRETHGSESQMSCN